MVVSILLCANAAVAKIEKRETKKILFKDFIDLEFLCFYKKDWPVIASGRIAATPCHR